MNAAVIHTLGEPPRYDDFPDPVQADGEEAVRISAAAISTSSGCV